MPPLQSLTDSNRVASLWLVDAPENACPTTQTFMTASEQFVEVLTLLKFHAKVRVL